MAPKLVPRMEPLRVGARKPFHAVHQIASRRLDEQMQMVGPKTPGMDVPVSLGLGLAKGLQKRLAIMVVAKARLAMIAPAHHRIDRPRIWQSKFSGRERQRAASHSLLSILRIDPV